MFDAELRQKSIIGGYSSSAKSLGFNGPTGLAVNRTTNQLIVADWGFGNLRAFDTRSNQFIGWVTTDKSNLFGPQGITVNETGLEVMVCDSGNHCIKGFSTLLNHDSSVK